MAIFDKLKNSQPKEEKKASGKKETVLIVKNKNSKDASGNLLYENIKEFRDKQAQISILEAEKDALYAEIESDAKEAFQEHCNSGGKVDTVVIQAITDRGAAARVQFIPVDKYTKVDKDKATTLREKYGNDIVTEEDIVTINVNLFKKYEKQFETLLKKIAPEDADKVFSLKTLYSVTKGTVEKVPDLAKENDETIIETMNSLGVITQLKAPKVEEEVSAVKSALVKVAK